MAQIESSGGESNGRHGRRRAKKLSTRIDMTPMVDLAFLLLTFFVLTATFSKPKVLRMIFPEKKKIENPEDVPVMRNGVTVILDGTDKVYYYEGGLKDAKELKVTDFSKKGLRVILKEKNKNFLADLARIQKEIEKGPKNDSLFNVKIKKMTEEAQMKSDFAVVVKHSPKATYKNMIDAVDEFLVTQVGKYFVVDEPLDKKEQEMLFKLTGK